MSERKLALVMTTSRDRYFTLANQIKEIIKSAPVDVVITTVDDWKSTHIENLTVEDLKQNEHVQWLLKDLNFYANKDSWFNAKEYGHMLELIDDDDLESVFDKQTQSEFIIGGKRARAKLKEWGL